MNVKQIFVETRIFESSSPHLIVVDVQPEYGDSMSFSIEDFAQWLNENVNSFQSVTFLFNGPDLGMVSKEDLQQWYYNAEMDETILNNSDFYDKGYAFFRNCMDADVDDEETVHLVRWMYQNDINDSRDIDEDDWEQLVSEFGIETAREIMQDTEDSINIPDLMEKLKDFPEPIAMVGGSADACLREVEIALKALGKKYKLINEWIYWGE